MLRRLDSYPLAFGGGGGGGRRGVSLQAEVSHSLAVRDLS